VGTIDTIADLAERYDVKPPSTIVVGEVVNVLLTEGDFVVEEYADESENNGARIRRIKRQGLLIQANVD
jgi:siroheme synthase